jgi:hypothetical protein
MLSAMLPYDDLYICRTFLAHKEELGATMQAPGGVLCAFMTW